MTDPLSFTAATPRHKLPYLFTGQAQKEFFVNEAHALADMLLHPAVQGEAATPPASPADGECWLVGTGASGTWSGHDGALASFQSGSWVFANPCNGMSVLQLSNGQVRRFHNGWHAATAVATPNGGATVDNEARTAISGLIAALAAAGILPAN